MNLLEKHGKAPKKREDDEGSMIVTGVRAAYRFSFGEAADVIAKHWKIDQAGATAAVTAASLQLNSGTTPNAQASAVLQTLKMLAPMRIAVTAKFSQANPANSDFFIELIDNADQVAAAWGFIGGQTTTQGRVLTFGAGQVAAAENASNLSLSDRATAARTYEIQLYPDEIRFSQRDPNTLNARSTGAIRNHCVPDPNAPLRLRIRVKNGATAPASATQLTITGIIVNDITEVPVDMTNTGSNSQAEAVPVLSVPGSSITATAAFSTNSGGAIPIHQSILAASTNAMVIRAAALVLAGGMITNPTAADVWLKLYNQTSAPAPATNTPVLTVKVPAGQQINLGTIMPAAGMRFVGLAILTTAAPAKTDTTAIAAGVIVELMGV